MATFGNLLTNGTTGETISSINVWGGKFTLSENGDATSVTMNIQKFTACSTKVYIYADNAGEPGVLVATSDVNVHAGGAPVIFQSEHAFTPAVALTAGDYWLVGVSNLGGAGLNLRAAAAGGIGGREGGVDLWNSPEDPLGTRDTTTAKLFEVFVTYTPTGGTDHTKALTDSVSVVGLVLATLRRFIKQRYTTNKEIQIRERDKRDMEKDLRDIFKDFG